MGSITQPTDFPAYGSLPTLDRLNVTLPEKIDAQKVAQEWLIRFSTAVNASDISGILGTIHPDGWWRDLIALTWDIRTFHGPEKQRTFLEDRLSATEFIVSPTILNNPLLARPYPDLVWIVTQFTFETVAGLGAGTALLVPSPSGEWQAFVVCTDLDKLKGVEEHFGPGRDQTEGRADLWFSERDHELAFEDHNPEVLIVGAGQAGLDTAARLKNFGVSTLIVERSPRVGDQWRKRYDSLRLHDFVWLDHTPYLKFPDSFPVHIPGKKLADWYEFYAKVMDLNVWTSTTVTNAFQDDKTGKWTVVVTKQDGSQRILNVSHVVFATGWVGEPRLPDVPGRHEFQGEVLHSADYANAKGYLGKKVIVVGACTSAHDIAVDCADLGIEVTMFQRSSTLMHKISDLRKSMAPLYREGGPPLEFSDKIAVTTPFMVHKLLGDREMDTIIQEDLERRKKLHAVGYRMGKGSPLWQIVSRGGGQYLDQGACDLMIEGKIKVKSETNIDRFTKTGLRFQDGTEIEADVVVMATGYGDLRVPVRRVIGEELGKKLTRVWSVNGEGEPNTLAREMGVPGLWYLSGSLSICRIYSKHLALQIKAKLTGQFTERYAAPPVY